MHTDPLLLDRPPLTSSKISKLLNMCTSMLSPYPFMPRASPWSKVPEPANHACLQRCVRHPILHMPCDHAGTRLGGTSLPSLFVSAIQGTRVTLRATELSLSISKMYPKVTT